MFAQLGTVRPANTENPKIKMFLEEFISVYCIEKLYTLHLELGKPVDYCHIHETCLDVNTACRSGHRQQPCCCWGVGDPAPSSPSKP